MAKRRREKMSEGKKNIIADIRHLSYEEAKQEILSYIYLYYNSEQLHSGIGYKTHNSVWM